MKCRKLGNAILLSFAAMALTAAVLALTSCAGLAAREHVLVPAMKMAWAGISSDIDVGISALTVDAASAVRVQQKRMAAALDEGSIAGILSVDWRLLREVAIHGILLRHGRGEIGPGVVSSLRERVAVFTQAFLKLEQGT